MVDFIESLSNLLSSTSSQPLTFRLLQLEEEFHGCGSQPRRVPWRDVKVANEAAEGSSSCRTCGCTPAALLTPREPDSTSAVSSRHPLGRRVMQRNWCGLVASAQAGP
ncbi:unnamed protein product [Caretta caretta]